MKAKHKPFYKMMGSIIKRERLEAGLTVGDLAKLADEQHKTIVHIESGKPFSMHHLVWMKNELGISFDNLNEYKESTDGEIKSITDLI
jgi:transcriptional regulator with XRE-family HTH domain